MSILLLVQPGLSKPCSLGWGQTGEEGLAVPGSERSPSLSSSPAGTAHCLPAAQALQVIKNEIRIEVLHTHSGCRAASPAKSMLLEEAQELLQC